MYIPPLKRVDENDDVDDVVLVDDVIELTDILDIESSASMISLAFECSSTSKKLSFNISKFVVSILYH